MTKPEDIPQWAWEKAFPIAKDRVWRNWSINDQCEEIARAILSAVEEENEACALEALRWEDGIDAAEHIRRRHRSRKEA